MVIPEPFSLLATSLGITATILNFLLSTIPSLEQKYYRFNNIDGKILKSLNALKDIEFSFQRWLDTYTWAQGPFHEQHYEDHFGKTEWQDIKYRRDEVMKYIGSLRQQLHLIVQPDTSDPQYTAPTPLENHSRHLQSSFQRVSKNLNHGIKKVFHLKKKEAASKLKSQPTPSSLEHASLQGLNTQEYEAWKSFVCLDRSPQLETPPISLGYKIIAILSAKWERIDRSIEDLNYAMTSLVSITSAYRKHREARQNEDLLKFATGREKNDFSRFAKYLSSEMMKPQDKRPRIGWHLQVSDFEGREKSSEYGAEIQPQKMLNEIVTNCHFMFATHVNIDANFSTRGLELKGVKGNMVPSGTTWKTPADLWCDKDFHGLSGVNSEWFLRIEDLPGLNTFRLKTSRAQRIKGWTKDWQKLLAEAMRNNHTRKIFDVERARLVCGLTVWMILLWEEDWFSHICTCSLRCVLFGETEDSDVGWSGTGTSAPFLLPLQHVYSLDTLNQGSKICWMRSCAGNTVPGPTSPEKKLQLFAILLAEILLVRKIVTDEDGRPSGRCNNVSEYELVQSVKLDVDYSIAEGLQFCFERAGGGGMWNELRTIEQQKELIERVLKPAKKYYQTLSSRPENKKWAEMLYWEVMKQQDEILKVVQRSIV